MSCAGAGPTLGVVRRKETCRATPGGGDPGASRGPGRGPPRPREHRAAAAASGRRRPSPQQRRQHPQLGEQAPPRDDGAGRPRARPRPARRARARGAGSPGPRRSCSLTSPVRPRTVSVAARGASPAPRPSSRGGARGRRTFPRNPPRAGDVCRPLRSAGRGRVRWF
uniref:serine/arginine repetitive matrix protein 1-like n=1 Tax=Panthera onca TaxID=9690 RepID=UPI002954E5C4|nr:serine/arginine repetitive matrix protein 1-like [Panthera onca]